MLENIKRQVISNDDLKIKATTIPALYYNKVHVLFFVYTTT